MGLERIAPPCFLAPTEAGPSRRRLRHLRHRTHRAQRRGAGWAEACRSCSCAFQEIELFEERQREAELTQLGE